MSAPVGVVLVAVLSLLAAAPAAAADRPCGAAVIADWADNGRVDRSYAPRCYGVALRSLPEDVRAYSTAVEDISRAMHARIGAEARNDGNEGNTALSGAASGGGTRGLRQLSSRGQVPKEKQEPASATGAVSAVASAVPKPSGTVPFPLVIGAALMLLLGLAGSTGLITRSLR
jgi:hypothetical protein